MLETLELKRTPFHERTSRLSVTQNWRRWAGHIVLGSYELSLEHEYWAIRDRAASLRSRVKCQRPHRPKEQRERGVARTRARRAGEQPG